MHARKDPCLLISSKAFDISNFIGPVCNNLDGCGHLHAGLYMVCAQPTNDSEMRLILHSQPSSPKTTLTIHSVRIVQDSDLDLAWWLSSIETDHYRFCLDRSIAQP